jgi:cell division protein ZapA (FtsZ GTPase activity inhibitor)
MEDDNRVIRVHIFGEEYPIKAEFGDDDQFQEYKRHVLEVARYVDQKMHEFAEKAANKSPKNVAVLVALNAADELIKLMKDREAEFSLFESRAGSLIDRLESHLQTASSSS